MPYPRALAHRLGFEPRSPDYETTALPTELSRLVFADPINIPNKINHATTIEYQTSTNICERVWVCMLLCFCKTHMQCISFDTFNSFSQYSFVLKTDQTVFFFFIDFKYNFPIKNIVFLFDQHRNKFFNMIASL